MKRLENGNNLVTRFHLLLPVAFFFISFAIGRYPLDPITVVEILVERMFSWSSELTKVSQTVVFNVRLPRIGCAILIGGGLSVSGAAFQGVFRNPLVSPFILGVASGAGFGASLAILFFKSAVAIQLFAFLFGAGAVFLTYGMTTVYRSSSSLVLVLAGVITGTFFSALISLIKFWADPFEKLPLIVFWLMGSLATVNNQDLSFLIFPVLAGVLVIYLIRWKMNVLSLGDEEAKSLGIETGLLKAVIIAAATVITASAVSIGGIIGWVGLVIPHLTRMITGPDYKKLIPVAFSFGACYLLLIDDIARTISSSEVPIGILTATVGAPVFALVIRKNSLGWS